MGACRGSGLTGACHSCLCWNDTCAHTHSFHSHVLSPPTASRDDNLPDFFRDAPGGLDDDLGGELGGDLEDDDGALALAFGDGMEVNMEGLPELLAQAVYGLPEVYRAQIKQASLVASPGCYPTSILLPAIPLLKAGLIEPGSIIADSLSGVSGGLRPVLDRRISNRLRSRGGPI